jgi:hypothetical protein
MLDFSSYQGTYSATDRNERLWRISATRSGWRLEFRDDGDTSWTYAGTHATLRAAQREAAR